MAEAGAATGDPAGTPTGENVMYHVTIPQLLVEFKGNILADVPIEKWGTGGFRTRDEFHISSAGFYTTVHKVRRFATLTKDPVNVRLNGRFDDLIKGLDRLTTHLANAIADVDFDPTNAEHIDDLADMLIELIMEA